MFILVFSYLIASEVSPLLSCVFAQVNEVHPHGTRSVNKICVNNLVTPRFEFSFVFRGAKLWNLLSDNVKSSDLSLKGY